MKTTRLPTSPTCPHMMTNDRLATVLREALAGTPGWRLRARQVLGLDRERQCPICLRWFDQHRSGTGKTCGRPSCQTAYQRRRARARLSPPPKPYKSDDPRGTTRGTPANDDPATD